MKERELTLGERRVNINFNTTGDTLVDKIKVKSAELIDLIETLNTPSISNEKYRAIEIAQKEIETGCMYGVKTIFID